MESQAGVPYADTSIATAAKDARRHAEEIALRVTNEGRVVVAPESEMVALIAYLQRLGLQESPLGQTP